MSDPQILPEARLRRSRGLALVWLVPIAAAAIVIWLGIREVLERGPLITITFQTAEGLSEGQTKVRHNAVDIGTVENVALSADLNKVVVTARLDRKVAAHVTKGAKFWIVRPRVSPGGISGLATLVSGSYIEMEPGPPGEPETRFVGLEEQPVATIREPGTRYTLIAPDLGSLGQGSPVYFRGLPVGEVLGDDITEDGREVRVFVFVRAPYNHYVRPQSRFWNASGISVTVGVEGLRASTESLQSLLTGGIAFSTAPEAMRVAQSPPSSAFRLYQNQGAAEAQPLGQEVFFLANFPGPVHGLIVGSPVELKGITVGRVTEVELDYDAAGGRLSTPATFEIEPDRIKLANVPVPADGNLGPAVEEAVARLVDQGLRARLGTGNLLTGQRVVSLEVDPDAPAATLAEGGLHPEVPAVESGDLDSLSHTATKLMSRVQALVDNLTKLTGSPEMAQSLKALKGTLANLERLSAAADTEVPPLVQSLHQTADAATRTLETANHELGGGMERSDDIRGLLHELTQAARSVRSLADFLDQHPEALLRGRTGSGQ